MKSFITLAADATKTKEMPPPRGVGLLWEVRAFGSSIRRRRSWGRRNQIIVQEVIPLRKKAIRITEVNASKISLRWHSTLWELEKQALCKQIIFTSFYYCD